MLLIEVFCALTLSQNRDVFSTIVVAPAATLGTNSLVDEMRRYVPTLNKVFYASDCFSGTQDGLPHFDQLDVIYRNPASRRQEAKRID
jgi:hypothetical protein